MGYGLSSHPLEEGFRLFDGRGRSALPPPPDGPRRSEYTRIADWMFGAAEPMYGTNTKGIGRGEYRTYSSSGHSYTHVMDPSPPPHSHSRGLRDAYISDHGYPPSHG